MLRKITLISLLFFLSTALFSSSYFHDPDTYQRSGEGYSELAPRARSHMGDPEWLFDLGWSYYEAGKYDEAVRYLSRAWELQPEMAFLSARLGMAYESAGNPDSAVTYYEKALNEHYEYIEVWERLVQLKPEYYANLGLLYTEKAEEYESENLVTKAKMYLNSYLQQFPGGEFAGDCESALSRLELLERQTESRDELESKLRRAQAREAERRAELKQDRESFRTEKPFLAGIGFYSIGLADDNDFIAINPDEVIDDTLSMKAYATNLNEFGIGGGIITGPAIIRGALRFGSTASGKNYFLRDPVRYKTPLEITYTIDSSSTPYDTVDVDTTLRTDDDVRPKVSSVNSWRFMASADYNFYYMNPVLLYGGVQGEIGSATLNDSPYDNFETISLAGLGLGGGIMLRFSDFLFDLSYRRNLVGSSAGGVLAISGMYKF